MTCKTEQEEFWAGSFGNEYIERNRDNNGLSSALLAFWSRILARTTGVESILELGANIGTNLHALHALLPGAELAGVEINTKASEELKAWGKAEVFAQSVFDFTPKKTWNLVFTKGVLIHLNSEKLPEAYDILYRSGDRYLCVAEYYNPTPMEVVYRGNTKKLFKRDFAGEMLERFPALRLLDYGFVWKRDPVFPQDDITWFLMEKR